MFDPTDWTRLTRYISGNCTAAEATSTKAWIAADPDRREIADHLQEIWETFGVLDGSDAEPLTFEEVERSWQRLEKKLDDPRLGPSQERRNGDGTAKDR